MIQGSHHESHFQCRLYGVIQGPQVNRDTLTRQNISGFQRLHLWSQTRAKPFMEWAECGNPRHSELILSAQREIQIKVHFLYLINLETRIIPALLLFKIVLAILVALLFYVSFRIILSISTKNLAGHVIGIVLSIYQFGENCHFYSVESCNSFTWCVSQFIQILSSFTGVVQFSAYMSRTCFVKFGAKYFILGAVIVNGILFSSFVIVC